MTSLFARVPALTGALLTPPGVVNRRGLSTEALITAAVLALVAVSVSAQRQFDELRRQVLPADSDWTFAVALGDVDGDGDLDIVFGNGGYHGEQNRLYLNDGAGTFADVTATHMPVDSDSTTAVALGDVDGDGDLDIVFGNAGYCYPYYPYWCFTEQNRLYLNDGTGTFTDVTATRMPTHGDWTEAVALGDVDVAGDLDMSSGSADRTGSI